MIFDRLRVRVLALLSSIVVFGAAHGAPPITAVGPAESKPATSERKLYESLKLPASAPATRIVLTAPSDAERGSVKAKNAKNAKVATTPKELAKGTKGQPLAIGFGRTVPAGSQRISLAALNWQKLADGSHAAKLQIVSPEAAAIRVALQLAATDPDLSVRFSGNATGAEVFGPVPANTIADDTARFGVFWSPTLDGDVATIEFHADAGAKIGNATLVVPRVAHHLITGRALQSPDSKTVSDIGTSDTCNIDVACVTPQTPAFGNARKAVAEILFTQDDGVTYLCTGTLLNDSITSGTPYFFTANHCINSATAARTLNTYWFFDAVACGNHTTIPPYVQQGSGAALLARSEDWDWALVRLNAAPPAGAFFSAWNAALVSSNQSISVIHHPQGDLKKWSAGFSPSYQFFDDGSSFIKAQYTQGTTEGGSSGSGLLTLNAGGFYEVRGGLFGGLASCDMPSGIDVFSRFDNLLPLVRQYLTPGNNPSNTIVVVEFYNSALRQYFISTDPTEINDFDTGAHPGWERTGFRFLAYATNVAGTNPVCRLREPANGNAHFYSANPDECAAIAAAHPAWVLESPNAFYIALPNTTNGACPAQTLPVWRFLDQTTGGYRYTADGTTRDAMSDAPTTWVPQGYGPNAVSMCTPDGQSAAANPTLDINQHGLSGSWFKPATSGQGVEVEIFPNISGPGLGSTQVSWFTFDKTTAGGAERQRWYTLSGAVVSGQSTASLTIYQNTGGNFNALPITTAQAVGTATLSFDTCTSGQLNYVFNDGSGLFGSIPLARLTQNVTCVVGSTPPTNADFALSGNWFSPVTSGQGITAEVNPASGLFFAWYTYASNGAGAGAAGQRWYTGQGAYTAGSRSITFDLYETTGGIFDTPSVPAPTTVKVGSGRLSFQSCNAATLEFNFTGGSSSGTSGAIALSRVGPVPPGCAI